MDMLGTNFNDQEDYVPLFRASLLMILSTIRVEQYDATCYEGWQQVYANVVQNYSRNIAGPNPKQRHTEHVRQVHLTAQWLIFNGTRMYSNEGDPESPMDTKDEPVNSVTPQAYAIQRASPAAAISEVSGLVYYRGLRLWKEANGLTSCGSTLQTQRMKQLNTRPPLNKESWQNEFPTGVNATVFDPVFIFGRPRSNSICATGKALETRSEVLEPPHDGTLDKQRDWETIQKGTGLLLDVNSGYVGAGDTSILDNRPQSGGTDAELAGGKVFSIRPSSGRYLVTITCQKTKYKFAAKRQQDQELSAQVTWISNVLKQFLPAHSLELGAGGAPPTDKDNPL